MSTDPKKLLRQLGIAPEKSRGQNFLFSTDAVFTVLEFAALTGSEAVLEVGPGLGALTQELRVQARIFRAVEVEEAFCRHLVEHVLPRDEVICGDVRDIDIEALFGDDKVVVVSNVPYSISSEFCHWLFAQSERIERASLLLQREFAERLAAEPGSRAYGALTVYRKRCATASLGAVVRGADFFPPAAVNSRLIALRFTPQVQVPQSFERVVRAAFSHRRKTLLNSLLAAQLVESKEEVLRLLEAAEISPKCRAETLDLGDFARLAKCYEEVVDRTRHKS
jgi:16S rRNA (adenine1518-N6/adenine1519-N6)-dimethyltransferase